MQVAAASGGGVSVASGCKAVDGTPVDAPVEAPWGSTVEDSQGKSWVVTPVSSDGDASQLLGKAPIPADVDPDTFFSKLYQWASTLTTDANLPLILPLKVDRVNSTDDVGPGVRIALCSLEGEGLQTQLIDLCAISIVLSEPFGAPERRRASVWMSTPPTGGTNAVPDLQLIMSSLAGFLKAQNTI